MVEKRRKIAVMFGGASPEYDVSVVTAQQVMDAADPRKYEVIPVFSDFENRLFTSKYLRDANRFRPQPPGLEEVAFGWGERGPELCTLATNVRRPIDCVVPIFHGRFGEDGRVQGMLELVGVPFTSFTATNAVVAMRKDLTKMVVAPTGVPVLPHVLVGRHDLGEPELLLSKVKALGYPLIIKPASLGSSIGVGVAQNEDEVLGVVRMVLGKDGYALIEPKVPNLVEYNISVRRGADGIKVSAIERPKPSTELLDFKEKYLSGGGGAKGTTLPSQGMLSLTREINPELPPQMLADIHRYAREAFKVLGMRGAPRLDFLCDSRTGQLWFNEINPIPGSCAFFLWERAPEEPLLFPELIDHLVNEALNDNLKSFDDPVPEDARLLTR